MKALFLSITMLLFMSFQVSAQELEMTGDIGYSIDLESGTANITVDKISNHNDGGSSGSLKLILFYSSDRYYEGTANGYVVAEYQLSDVLNGGEYFYDVDRNVSFTAPPDGDYYVMLFLTEWDGSQYLIVDNMNFDDKVHIETDEYGNTSGYTY